MTDTLTPLERERLAAVRDRHQARYVNDSLMRTYDRTPRIPPHVDAWLQDRYRDHPRRVAVDLRPRPRVPRRRVARAWGLGELAAVVFVALAIVGAFTLVNWVVGR